MKQYEKSGPVQIQDDYHKSKTPREDVVKMEQLIQDQQTQIAQLEREIRRIKNKLDDHATRINQIKHG